MPNDKPVAKKKPGPPKGYMPKVNLMKTKKVSNKPGPKPKAVNSKAAPPKKPAAKPGPKPGFKPSTGKWQGAKRIAALGKELEVLYAKEAKLKAELARLCK